MDANQQQRQFVSFFKSLPEDRWRLAMELPLCYLLAALVMAAFLFGRRRRQQAASTEEKKTLPGPRPWPLVGSLHLLAGETVPYRALDRLAHKYGPVFSLTLGSVPCLVVSSLRHVREVLINKGDHFDARPDFIRYHHLFSGDKENSLAFCDWSEVQKTRREMLRGHTFPRAFTGRFFELDGLLATEGSLLVNRLKPNTPVAIKPLMLTSCANVFLSYFCSTTFAEDDPAFLNTLRNFDNIFFEVNQGYAADFMPWLMPLHRWHLAKMARWSGGIRQFMMDCVVAKRAANWTPGKDRDYIDALLDHVNGENAQMTLDTAMFALEDIVGGHSAVANLLVKVLGMVGTRPHVQAAIQKEVDEVTRGAAVSLADRPFMPYTEAVVLEAIRHISSPIVPHVANRNTTVGGYNVDKGTLVLLNNYTLNMSKELWTDPEEFQPERFLSAEGRLSKPEHYLPFGGGRRSCMGYKMTQLVSFSIIASLLQRFSITPAHPYTIPLGNLALPYHTFELVFHPR